MTTTPVSPPRPSGGTATLDDGTTRPLYGLHPTGTLCGVREWKAYVDVPPGRTVNQVHFRTLPGRTSVEVEVVTPGWEP